MIGTINSCILAHLITKNKILFIKFIFFKVDGLLEYLQNHMIHQVSIDNCLEILAYSDFHSLKLLRQAVKEFTMEHFTELLYNDSINLLSYEVFR